MADKGKNAKDNKKKTTVAPKPKAPVKAKAKDKTAAPKKTARTSAKAKTAANAKKPKKQEPKPPAKVMKELEQLAIKHGGQANVPPLPKTGTPKSAETKVQPPKNGKVKEITVKYRFD